MPKKRFTPEQIIAKLRQIEVQLAQGKSVALASKDAAISEQSSGTSAWEIFYSLKEAQVIIGAWKNHYNRVRPHSSLGYRPPAPMTMEAIAQQLPTSTIMQ
jgi:putative transposase